MKLAPRRLDWFVIVTSIVCAVSCSGGGCGGCTTFTPIPGGFAPAKRNANAVQVRVAPSALAFIESNPAKAVGGLLGGGANNGVIQFQVPASNCASDNPALCCDSNNNPVSPCGPIDIDLNQHTGDPAVLALTPAQGASRLDLSINTRVKTAMDVPLNYDTGIFGTLHCGLHVDSTQGSTPYFTIVGQINFVQDATSGTTRINATNVAVNNVEGSDISLTGDASCAGVSFLLSFAPSFISGQIATQLQNTINNATCKSCPSGNVAECGSSFATACTSGTCMEGNQCLQELGLDGRATGVSLFGGFSPGTTGGIDVYEVTGGYATSDNGGIALGLLGGMEPAGAPRDQCGPPSTEPAKVTIPQSAQFQGSAWNDGTTSHPYDVGIGLHASQLTQFAYAGYNGGLLCLTIGHSTVAQLTTDTLSLLSRSLGKLVQSSSPMAVGLRPQSPPTIALGKNTFMSDGMGNNTLVEPLLDIRFQALEIDFFAEVDQQWVRVFTVVSDVHLPVGLETTGAGSLTPVLGNPMDAFTNISVKNSDAVTETPDALAGLFPSLLGIVLPQLSSGLSPIKLPTLGGLALDVTAVTSVDNDTFLGIFANLAPAMRPAPVHTRVEVVSVAEPDPTVMHDSKRWAASRPPEVTLALAADASDVEYSIRIDDGTWSPWGTNARPTLSLVTFWLPGIHHVDARARRIGHPETIDLSPPRVPFAIGGVGAQPAARIGTGGADFHGSAGASGCGCDARDRGAAGSGAVLALAILFVLAPLRRVRRYLARLGTTVWLVAIACLPGCDCSSAPCGSAKCMTGEVAHAPGKWTSVAGDDQRVMIATYDPQNGDLVAIDATNPSSMKETVVDGVPSGATPTYDPSTYRGGISDAGPDVGAWTSIALANHSARIAYQDRDAQALKYAAEDGDHHWHSHVVDDGAGVPAGEYANLVIDADGNPAIAYLVIGVDDGMGHRVTELQLARSGKASPTATTDWTINTIASAPGTCAGLCSNGDVCVPGTPETCATPTSSCNPGCGSAQACVNNACVTPLADPMIDDVPTGTGLWVSLVVMPDGRLGAAYYDQTRRALILAVESAKGSNQFMENILDGNVAGADRGMWSSAVVAADGTVHIAYQDALGDQLMYTTWNGQAGTPQVVDDGTRAGDRTHPVGSGNAIYLVNGSPAIAYQDGMVADVYVATQAGTTWTTTPLATGPLLDGFSIGATTAHGGTAILAWDLRDPSKEDSGPPNGIAVMQP